MQLVTTLALAALAGMAAGESLKKLDTSLTILANNDLQGPASPDAEAVILTDARPLQHVSQNVCAKLGEQLWKPRLRKGRVKRSGSRSGSGSALPFSDYLKYAGAADDRSRFWVASGSGGAAVSASGGPSKAGPGERLRGFCTNSAPFSNTSSQDAGARWQISLEVNNQTITGFRDRLSFRFLGIRFAPQPPRFTYPTLFRGSGEAASALAYGSQCVQGSDAGSEDCLFLNVWTPYLPNPNAPPPKGSLRPVAVWIHGGAFIGGTAGDQTFDGGNMASRGDMVVVAINYRLNALGFLALKDGKTNGNFGLADQVTALDWVRANIRALGGDPDRVTVFGQSAGAGSVRALLASPKARGKFANAILLSNLGGIQYGATYSRYYTIDEQLDVVGRQLLANAGCAGARSQVDCLRALPAHQVVAAGDARFLVVDGTYLTGPELDVSRSAPRDKVNVMLGITRDDGAPFIAFPGAGAPAANRSEYLTSVGLPVPPEALFAVEKTGNATLDLFNQASRIATDGVFRCIDQATTYAGLVNGRWDKVWYYEFDRTYQVKGWPQLDVCDAPVTETHPFGDPSKPYLKCHSGELLYVFGNLHREGFPMRDAGDLPFEQYVLDSFAAFARQGDPNPDRAFLRARGYDATLKIVEGRDGRWEPSTKRKLALRVLDWPRSRMSGFRDEKQCAALGLGLDYYLKKR
ncbi:hypothetical protein VTJ83DRAFT_2536 [Remersonia thermophila]|uniref:Carboxylesterase type B domain-containing protein n=1 Tax=Remersonia thermophila TaxID=72144 RepID=A0ABR4DJ77_9PEZI